MSEENKEDRAWFEPLYKQMAEGGLAAMLHDLLEMDLGDWHPRHDRPQTEALVDQKVESLRGGERLWFEHLFEGSLPSGAVRDDGSVIIESEDLLQSMRKQLPKLSANRLSTLLHRPRTNDKKSKRGMDFVKDRPSGKPTIYVIPPLPEARKRWDERRFKVEWDDGEEWHVRCRPF